MKTILIIDDDVSFHDVAGAALKERGYEVRSAKSGIEGLAAIKASVPDAILLDVKMPGMNGIEVLRSLRKDSPALHIPVIIVSNDSSLDTISEGAELGVRSYVLKASESLGSIADTVDRVFKKS